MFEYPLLAAITTETPPISKSGLLVEWLEYDHGGFGWPQRGVGVEVLVDLGPAGPQPFALVSLRAARMDRSRPVAGLGGDVG